ncbi:MAG TPA: ParA family protein, partial [Synergistaceae bacterium]|nr:ParA family protein [Synergistaceae bacterium]
EKLTLGGIVLTMFDPRTRLAREVVEEARKSFKEQVFSTVIPRNVRLSEAPSFGEPILYYDAASSGAEAYRELGKEVAEKWLEKR